MTAKKRWAGDVSDADDTTVEKAVDPLAEVISITVTPADVAAELRRRGIEDFETAVSDPLRVQKAFSHCIQRDYLAFIEKARGKTQ